MKRFWYVCIMTLVLLTSGGFSASGSMAQAGVLPHEDLILRIQEDEQWMFTGAEGDKNVTEVVVVLNGEPQAKISPITEARYEEHNVRDVYGFRAQIRPVNNIYDKTSTGAEIQLMEFETAADATAYQEGFFDAIYEDDLANNNGDLQLQLIEQLPDSPYPTVGWTYRDTYFGSDGNPIGHASAMRLVARHESTLISVRIAGPFIDFNFDFAIGLLQQQSDCVAQNVVCDPVTISQITPDWQYDNDGTLYYVNDASESLPARFVFPVEEPVRAPESGTLFDAAPESGELTSDTQPTRTTRTTGTGNSSSASRVVRTPRTSTNNESSGTTRTTRTVRTSTASTNAEPANATVIVEVADVFVEPDTNADVLTTLAEGDRITVAGEPELFGSIMWVPVVTESGQEGWMLIQDIWKD